MHVNPCELSASLWKRSCPNCRKHWYREFILHPSLLHSASVMSSVGQVEHLNGPDSFPGNFSKTGLCTLTPRCLIPDCMKTDMRYQICEVSLAHPSPAARWTLHHDRLFHGITAYSRCCLVALFCRTQSSPTNCAVSLPNATAEQCSLV